TPEANQMMTRTLAVLLLVFVARLSLAAPTAAQKCSGAKLKAAGTEAQGKAKCYRKALLGSATVDEGCLDDAETKFAGAFVRAEAAGGCTTTNDAGGVEAEVDDCLDSFVGAISGNAKCAATKMNAVGKKTKAKMLCHRKSALTGTGVSSSCLGAAEASFTTAI